MLNPSSAVLRIIKELERSEKMVWFLAPTVPLASQQFEVLRAQIPGVQSRLICGSDGVEAWSEQKIWDDVLSNVRIVVSTPQILLDAVNHAFVRLDSLSLIVFDEAHNCVKRNPGARLMNEWYKKAKAAKQPVPHILGLTASPLMRSNLDDLEALEATMDAVCRSPSEHRDELMAQVNRPEMMAVAFGPLVDPSDSEYATPAMSSLRAVHLGLDIKQDPYVLQLRAQDTPRSRQKLVQAIMQHKTYTQQKLKALYSRAGELYKHIGAWAADYYLSRVISIFLDDLHGELEDWNDDERRYLADAFRKIDLTKVTEEPIQLSAKTQKLLEILGSHTGDTMGIVFVKERATVAVLSHILSVHPSTRGRYRVGSMVGTSKAPGSRKVFLDLSRKEDLFSLENFRKGKTNLLVATSVLEEGIDVPACNLVICFDEPSNLKSFIQRRGRARTMVSKLYLLVEDLSNASLTGWQKLEQDMKLKYEDDQRERTMLGELEDSEPDGYPVLVDETTGARLTIRDAKQHLEHFCATLSAKKFVDWTPYYVTHQVGGQIFAGKKQPLIKATVHLPVTLAPELRKTESRRAWFSEKNAIMDAAFQAYQRLYRAGLVNQNLLPLRESDLFNEVKPRAGIATVKELLNPWAQVALSWQANGDLFKRRLIFSNREKTANAEFELVLPVPIPNFGPLTFYWGSETSWLITMEPDAHMSGLEDAAHDDKIDHTNALLELAFGYRPRHRPDPSKQYPLRLVSLGRDIGVHDMAENEFDPDVMRNLDKGHIIRHITEFNHPYMFAGWLPTKPKAELVGRPFRGFETAPEDQPYVVVKTWPKRAGSFHPVSQPEGLPSTKPYHRVLPASQIGVDHVPAVFMHFSQLIPAFTHALEVHLIARDLLESRLHEIGIVDLSLVVTAICSTASRMPTNYQRVEFLGDSILKFCTTINAAAKYLLFPEGWLSVYKDNIVSNSRLCRAAIEFGLDRYIVYKQFTLHKWTSPSVEDLVQTPLDQTLTRQLATKTLADVVEALIGISFISGGTPKALKCMSLFLPDVKWQSVEAGREALYQNTPDNVSLLITLKPVESLLGYTFNKKSLLVEAMTHPSFSASTTASLDRLEFIGDAILDYIIVKHLFAVNDPAPLNDGEMHLLRTALVNGDILAFFIMEWAIEEDRIDPDVDPTAVDLDEGGSNNNNNNNTANHLSFTRSKIKLPMWSFMRHSSGDLGIIQRATAQRHAAMRDDILAAIQTGTHYPWALLARLQAQKFYSDIFESVLGAVWVDSGSLEACEQLVEKIGILPYMRRLMRDKVHALHPKEELGRLACNQRVEYFTGEVEAYVGAEKENEDDVEKEWWCRVMVGERSVVEVVGGVSREEARVRAAMEACRILKEEKASAVTM
ncbi:hypothetical protein B0T22DRAFT_255922 [Podospora appendiculata]|uniref:Dicer-like protein 2 n=1 Tax=Podospora appendiculata TaxID=314037 RepID=A0AAE0X2T1_9PEZI|nr:hypothetical protein B0T22DRAFT_255922 [Podospora appendiculata]